MENHNKLESCFHDLKSRELSGFRVRKRPYIYDVVTSFTDVGTLAVEHNGEETPPMSASFCKTSKYHHILAVSDENGYVSLHDTRCSFPSSSSYLENTEKARISDWEAHHNAIFDICWIKEDTQILTASGDQMIKVWDAQKSLCLGVLTGHTGSVKSLSSHPTNPDIIVSGSRDGSFALWDLRCNSKPKSRRGELYLSSTVMVKKAHVPNQAKRGRSGKAASMSITSVLHLKDGLTIATAGAIDSVVKFWDTRNLKAQLTQTSPHLESLPTKDRILHGVSSLSQDLNGVFLSASCMDHRVYLYNMLQLEKGPLKSFSGCRIESFFVKSSMSPDARHILSGSSNGMAYVWQVDKPQADPIRLTGHEGEVTAVDWGMFEAGKIATASDDFTVRLWNMQNISSSTTRTPTSVRRRVMATPPSSHMNLLPDKDCSNVTECTNNVSPSKENLHQNSPESIEMPKISTPELQKKASSSLDFREAAAVKTPEAALKSPSSVLNPPSSSKRTIRDYFITSL